MSKALNLKGKRFSRLLVLERVNNALDGKTRWLCKCDCGNRIITQSDSLISGKTKSCGCYRKEVVQNLGKSKIKHGMAHTRLFNIWCAMKSRCLYSNNHAFGLYGGRGIKVCDEWLQFEPFMQWALSNGYKDDLTIDRINVNGNYEPSNCRWATYEQQENNRSNNRYFTINGETKTISQWAKIIGISRETLANRINSGWEENELFLPPNLSNSKIRKRGNLDA